MSELLPRPLPSAVVRGSLFPSWLRICPVPISPSRTQPSSTNCSAAVVVVASTTLTTFLFFRSFDFYAPRTPSLLSVPYHSFGCLAFFYLFISPILIFLRRHLSLHKSDTITPLPRSGIASDIPGFDQSNLPAQPALRSNTYIHLTPAFSICDFRGKARLQPSFLGLELYTDAEPW